MARHVGRAVQFLFLVFASQANRQQVEILEYLTVELFDHGYAQKRRSR
jgi:hypothetical protein